MLRSILTALLMSVLVVSTFGETHNKTKSPSEIMETVVIVDSSSGVVVFSDTDKSLVLTAYHVIQDKIEGEPQDIYVIFLYFVNGMPFVDKHKVEDLTVDELNDLALLEIHPGRVLDFSSIATEYEDPEIGEDIFIGSNPNFKYRALKKGIISSKTRYSNGSALTWEVSAGIVFGSSGGGAFTMNGKVFGVVRSVEPLKTDCWEEEDEKGKTKEVCNQIPIYHMGYISTPQEIRSFILSGKYSKDFSYLR